MNALRLLRLRVHASEAPPVNIFSFTEHEQRAIPSLPSIELEFAVNAEPEPTILVFEDLRLRSQTAHRGFK